MPNTKRNKSLQFKDSMEYLIIVHTKNNDWDGTSMRPFYTFKFICRFWKREKGRYYLIKHEFHIYRNCIMKDVTREGISSPSGLRESKKPARHH